MVNSYLIYNWNKSKVDSFFNEVRELFEIPELQRIKYPSLGQIISGNYYLWLYISGGDLKKEYVIKMIIPPDYPNEIPRFSEISNNIDKTADKHVNTIDNCFCLESPFNFKKYFRNGIFEVYNVINELLIPFLLAQEFCDIHGKFLAEYSHGPIGLFESLEESFGISNPLFLMDIAEAGYKNELKPYNSCPCMSGKQIFNCHPHISNVAASINFDDDYITKFVEKFPEYRKSFIKLAGRTAYDCHNKYNVRPYWSDNKKWEVVVYSFWGNIKNWGKWLQNQININTIKNVLNNNLISSI